MILCLFLISPSNKVYDIALNAAIRTRIKHKLNPRLSLIACTLSGGTQEGFDKDACRIVKPYCNIQILFYIFVSISWCYFAENRWVVAVVSLLCIKRGKYPLNRLQLVKRPKMSRQIIRDS